MNLDTHSNLYQEQLYLEQKFLNFDDDLNLRNCAKTKLWHSMNFEKPTKSFCMLAKAQKGNDSLNQLKKGMNKPISLDFQASSNLLLCNIIIYIKHIRLFKCRLPIPQFYGSYGT